MASQTTAVTPIVELKQDKRAGESLTARAMKRLRRDWLTLLALAVIVIMALLSIGAEWISSNILQVDYSRTNISEAFLPPFAPGHVLGTDDLGRDHMARSWGAIIWRACYMLAVFLWELHLLPHFSHS